MRKKKERGERKGETEREKNRNREGEEPKQKTHASFKFSVPSVLETSHSSDFPCVNNKSTWLFLFLQIILNCIPVNYTLKSLN